jgi:predicted phage terminase large subunit-like protein
MKSYQNWKKLGESNDASALFYRWKLSAFIQEQLYAYDNEAIKNEWRLGALHREWDKYLNKLRVRILAPRDHLKTFYFSISYPICRVRFNPNDEIYIFSKTDRQAVKILDSIKRVIRRTPFLLDLAEGGGVDFWNKTELRCSNGATIYAQGFFSAIRGAHPKCIILDDPIDTQIIYSDEQNKKTIERYMADILPIAEPDTQIIIAGTLQREDDLYSALDPSQWLLKNYSAIVSESKKQTLYPEKWDWQRLMARKKEISYKLGEKFFLKEYCNLPVQILGELVKKDWIKYYKPSELPDGDDYAGFDLAVGKDPDKGDYFAAVVFRITSSGDYYIRHVYRARLDFGARLKAIVRIAQQYPSIKKLRIEENTFQADTVQLLKKETNLPIEGIKTTENKVKRFSEELSPLFENGKVYVLQNMTEFINEILTLPRSKYDDMCDAFLIGKRGLGLQINPKIRWL